MPADGQASRAGTATVAGLGAVLPNADERDDKPGAALGRFPEGLAPRRGRALSNRDSPVPALVFLLILNEPFAPITALGLFAV